MFCSFLLVFSRSTLPLGTQTFLWSHDVVWGGTQNRSKGKEASGNKNQSRETKGQKEWTMETQSWNGKLSLTWNKPSPSYDTDLSVFQRTEERDLRKAKLQEKRELSQKDALLKAIKVSFSSGKKWFCETLCAWSCTFGPLLHADLLPDVGSECQIISGRHRRWHCDRSRSCRNVFRRPEPR